MAEADFNTNTTNPLIGVFPEDTISACCGVLAYLQKVQPMDALTDQEVFGLSNIHGVIEHALASEIERITTYRMAVSNGAAHHD